MGRVITNTGITFNFGGTATDSVSGREIDLSVGTTKTQIYVEDPDGHLHIDNLARNITLETDNGNLTLFANGASNSKGTVTITMGTGAIVNFNKGVSTKIAELDASGNLKIAGTLGTGVVF